MNTSDKKFTVGNGYLSLTLGEWMKMSLFAELMDRAMENHWVIPTQGSESLASQELPGTIHDYSSDQLHVVGLFHDDPLQHRTRTLPADVFSRKSRSVWDPGCMKWQLSRAGDLALFSNRTLSCAFWIWWSWGKRPCREWWSGGVDSLGILRCLIFSIVSLALWLQSALVELITLWAQVR